MERKRPGMGQAERHQKKETRWPLNAERTQQSAGLQGGSHVTRKGARRKDNRGQMQLGLDQEKSEQLRYWDPDAQVFVIFQIRQQNLTGLAPVSPVRSSLWP